MNSIINTILNFIRAHKYLLYVVGVIVLAALILLYGARAWNGVSSWWFQRGVQADQKELQETKALAADLLRQLSVEKAKREAAEKVLADKHLTSEEKLKEYERQINAPVVVSPVPTDTESLCARAKSLGVECR